MLTALSSYKWPDVRGLESFQGHRVHSAAWDHDFDYSHKRIAVIGNGSSGVQIVPQLAKLAGATVTNFARGSAWIYYRVPPSQHLGNAVSSNKNPPYSEEQKQQFREDPDSMRQLRRGMIARTNKAFRMVCVLPRTCIWRSAQNSRIFALHECRALRCLSAHRADPNIVHQRYRSQFRSHANRRRADARTTPARPSSL